MQPTLEQCKEIGDLNLTYRSYVDRGFEKEDLVKALGRALKLINDLTSDDNTIP